MAQTRIKKVAVLKLVAKIVMLRNVIPKNVKVKIVALKLKLFQQTAFNLPIYYYNQYPQKL
jgi:hypothetical protein